MVLVYMGMVLRLVDLRYHDNIAGIARYSLGEAREDTIGNGCHSQSWMNFDHNATLGVTQVRILNRSDLNFIIVSSIFI